MTSTNRSVAKRLLGSRDRAILDDAIRMRLVTNAIVQKRHMRFLTENAVTKITSKLCAEGWLVAHQLNGRRVYFTPGIRSVRAFDLSHKLLRPLGSQSFPTWFAIANHVANAETSQRVTTREEVQKVCSWLPTELAAQPHIVHQKNDSFELVLLRVDLGGSVKHIAQKCKEDIDRRLASPEFGSLLEAKAFVHCILTTTKPKEVALRQELSTHRWPDGLRFRTSVVPELLSALGTE